MADALSDLVRIWDGSGEESYDGATKNVTEVYRTPDNKWDSRAVYKNLLMGSTHPDGSDYSDLEVTSVGITPFGDVDPTGGPGRAILAATYGKKGTYWEVSWRMGGEAITISNPGWVWSDTFLQLSDTQAVRLFPKTTYTFTGKIYKSTFVESDLESAVGKTNSDTWYGKAPGTVLFLGMDGKEKIGLAGSDMIDCTLNMAYQPTTWNKLWRQKGTAKGFRNIWHVRGAGRCTLAAATSDVVANDMLSFTSDMVGDYLFISDAVAQYWDTIAAVPTATTLTLTTARPGSPDAWSQATARIVETEGPYETIGFGAIFGAP